MDPDIDFLQSGPVRDETYLLDSPDFLIETADEIIYLLNNQIAELKAKNGELETYKKLYFSLCVSISLEIDKLKIIA